ncbi:MAG: asparagine synthase (glutamine-hydrolyzing) [Legionellaceae bacterium]|nr:asparagine synthase (glutamine-hydrolyzing) [Legionellaceae bacterium]
MCGLTGFFDAQANRQDSTAVISRMTNKLTHRGPDDSGIWLNNHEGLALGHQRLAILDLSSAGRQPMQSHHGRYVIIYNGEIYNTIALKKQLQEYSFSGHSDTEVILALIEKFGLEDTLKQITGMFAFALWDKTEKQLHLVRDRIGEKPLYYGMVNGAFVFASELKAIREYPNFNNQIARSSISLFMEYGYIPAPESIYEGIYKLKPGTFITISKENMSHLPEPREYWSATQTAQAGIISPQHLSDTIAINQVHTLLSSVVKNQMVSDVPIGAFLSGGIDSSLITALMQENCNQPVKTFTIGFQEKQYNEAEYAKAVANHLQTDHTELYVSAHDALSVIPNLPMIYDEPFADSSAIPTYLVSELTKKHVTVCLSGDGGDELFGGYNRYLMGKSIWRKMAYFPYPIRVILQKILFSLSSPLACRGLSYAKASILANKIHKLASIMTERSLPGVYQHLITQWQCPSDIVKTNDLVSTKLLLNQIEEMNFVEKMMITDTVSYLPDDILVKVDRAGMAVGLENRAPFLDHNLIELMWKLPLNMKIRNHTTKWILREILSKYVTEPLFNRPKMGFGIPLDAWLRGPLRDWSEHLLDKNKIEQQGYLRPEPILKKWHEHLSGRRNWQYQLWPILMFQAWLDNLKYS